MKRKEFLANLLGLAALPKIAKEIGKPQDPVEEYVICFKSNKDGKWYWVNEKYTGKINADQLEELKKLVHQGIQQGVFTPEQAFKILMSDNHLSTAIEILNT